MHRLSGAGAFAGGLVLYNLTDNDLEQGRQFVTLVLLLLEFVEETGQGFRPALVHLDHLGLNV